MIPFLLVTSIFAELLAALAVAYSIRFPGRRIWPPDSHSSQSHLLMGFLFLYPSIGIGILGMVDWGSFSLPLWCRIAVGIPPLLGGSVLFLWAAAILGIRPMFGGGGPLTVSGPFRFSRNPQYAGCLLMLIGWNCVAASQAAGIASLFGFLPLVMVPFAEESWLEEKFGLRYKEFAKRVPRFILF
jgi:protein-S-isoprenylcysteine O-methyltransferase Ste14